MKCLWIVVLLLSGVLIEFSAGQEYEDDDEYDSDTLEEEDDGLAVREAFDKLIGEDTTDLLNHPDPNVTNTSAYGVAWIEHLSLDAVNSEASFVVNDSIDLRGEIRIVQEEPTNRTTEITMWFEAIPPGNYAFTVRRYGDMTFPDNLSFTCDNAGPQFKMRGSSEVLWVQFTVPQNETDPTSHSETFEIIDPPILSDLCPLWGYDSVVGRMIVLYSLDEDYAHTNDPASLYTENSTSDEKRTTVGCGVVGIANDFTVYVGSESSNTALTKHSSLVTFVLFCTLTCLFRVVIN